MSSSSKSSGSKGASAPASNKIQRRRFVAELLSLRAGAAVVPGLGSATWDCFASGDSPEYLYSWGGMGLAVPTALGLALAQPKRRVLALTGDGEMMMGIGSLAVVADQAPSNLGILVLDNESFGETGRQTGLSAGKTDLAAVARGFGITATFVATAHSDIPTLTRLLFETPGPTFAVAKIALSEDPWALPEKDGAAIARRFQVALGVAKP
jgi:thiamine pyrophosphate-dependent acetolactate synthase large subunit-like protein